MSAATIDHGKLGRLRREVSQAREDWEEAVFLVDHFPHCNGYRASLNAARRKLERAEAAYEREQDKQPAW